MNYPVSRRLSFMADPTDNSYCAIVMLTHTQLNCHITILSTMGDCSMATFISTVQFTDQGMKDIKSTSKRAEAFQATAEKMGIVVKHIFWTLGRFDGLVIFDSPDEETATALMLQLASYGNVHTETTRAYEASEIEQILSKLST